MRVSSDETLPSTEIILEPKVDISFKTLLKTIFVLFSIRSFTLSISFSTFSSTVLILTSRVVVVVVSSTTSSFFAFLTGAFFFLGVVGSTTSYVVFSTCSGTHSSTTTEVVFLVGAILSNTLLILSRDGFLTFLLLVERGIII